jgi:hypothetical protein
MQWTRRQFVATLLCAAAMHRAVAAPPASEQKLIDQLLHDVGQMRDMVFIRNGTEYSALEAESHLRDKMDYFKDDIHTADDFIRLCATRSEMSGIPYRVRDGHGQIHEAAVFLKARLDQLRATAQR